MICPICGKEFHRPPAISRCDGSSICSRDGTKEALEDLGMDENQVEGILNAIYGEECE